MRDVPRIELELLRDDVPVRVVAMRDRRLTIGRALSNDLVLIDDDVAPFHAVVSSAPGGIHVEDLNTVAGTFVNGQPVLGQPRVLVDDDRVRLGATALLRVRFTDPVREGIPILEDVVAGTAWLIDRDRFVIGSGPDCQLRVPGVAERAATLLVVERGGVQLGVDDEATPLAAGDTFVVGDRTFRLGMRDLGHETTLGRVPAHYPYRLDVRSTRIGSRGVEATLHDLVQGRSHTITAANRAALLYVLGKRLHEDRAAGRFPMESGWCDDEDVLIGVWGRERARPGTSHYSVLLHRLRRELEDARFDPWCIEKRRGATRLCIAEVQLA